MKKELVLNWMSADVVTIPPKMTIPEAQQIMDSEEIRRLPVINARGKLVGIVSQGDLRAAQPSMATTLSIWELNALLSKLTIDEIMTHNPITVSADATIGDAARIMLEHRISGLPVIKDNQIVGIITESDIFSLIVLNEWRETADEAAELEMAL